MTTPTSRQNAAIITQEIIFRGTVQGVGFRPTVAGLARSFGMSGQVRNMGGSVQLIVTDTEERIDAFLLAIKDNKPAASDIVRAEIRTIDTVSFRGFAIEKSGLSENEAAVIPSDIAVCEDCLREFYDESNPRYKHPFISCAVCGPRFTVMERLPYDRDTTSMIDFDMCEFCAEEYVDADNRRFHAQTISCHDCGPMAEWFSVDDEESAQGTAIDKAIDALREGGVIAFKGVGGYYFACSPFTEEAVREARAIKIREEKPFAVLFRDAEAVRDYCVLGAEEEAQLRSSKRPIVLLARSDAKIAKEAPFDPGVCNSSRFIGAFLPSMGLQYILSDALGPLVMTSANLSDLPIIKDDEEMRALVSRDRRVAGMLYNRRRIAVSADDSVLRMTDGTPQLIRRSKGYVPTPVFVRGAESLTTGDRIFATGGQLKSAFSLSKGNFAYMSRYIGDLDNIESERAYEDDVDRMKRFFDIEPNLIVCDMHPLYFTTKFAEECVENASRTRSETQNETALLRVQHHHAHTASVMAEHGLSGPVIGVSFDGTGYGEDGKIWGGEVLVCEGADFTRFSHLRYVGMVGGDASMKDGRKSAISHMLAWKARQNAISRDEEFATDGTREFDIDLSEIIACGEKIGALTSFPQRAQIEAAISAGVNTVESSSMGRLFDAVASILGIHDVNRYEGECAVMLENAAAAALECGEGEARGAWGEAGALALRFHRNVAAAVLEQCEAARETHRTATVALSGGVFQNKILMEEALALLRANDFEVYYNIAVPPNDGGIALGQNYIGMQRLLSKRTMPARPEDRRI
ncbi:MAG: carbamoyltransferase HypF [Clostridiales Family XIII bacterium]|nr:carbamoyltransferase HypF [Clostridiales Family XIII bacterium]